MYVYVSESEFVFMSESVCVRMCDCMCAENVCCGVFDPTLAQTSGHLVSWNTRKQGGRRWIVSLAKIPC